MSSPVVFILGTPPGRWPARAASLLPSISALPAPVQPYSEFGGVCTDLRGLEALLEQWPAGARALVFVEAPATALAPRLLDDSFDMPRWLADWKEAGRHLLRLIQRHRDRCLVIDADDEDQPTDALPARLGSWLSMPLQGEDLHASALDPLVATMARVACEGDPSVRRLQEELMACCDWPAETRPASGQPSAAQALARLRELHADLRTHRRQLEKATTSLAEARHQSAAVRAERDGLSEQLQLFDKEMGRLSDELDATRGAASALRQLRDEQDALLVQFHAAQEALEQALVKLRAPTPSVAPCRPADDAAVRIKELRPAGPRDERPHREITWHARQIEVLGRTVPSAELRLVEHHGRPGLVVMGANGGAGLLRHWQETGREEDRPYMLLVPSDPGSAAALEALDSADWLALLAAIARIEAELAQSHPKLRPTWGPLAQRLAAQLRALPPRWRHGGVQVTEDQHGADPAWRVDIADVHFGHRHLARLSLHWQPEGAAAGLALICPDAGLEPLLVWPDDERGDVPEHLWLPIGGHAADTTAWRALPLDDRRFALEAARALPRLLANLQPSALPPTPHASHWLALAERVASEAQRLLSHGGSPPVSLVRRVARRMRRAP